MKIHVYIIALSFAAGLVGLCTSGFDLAKHGALQAIVFGLIGWFTVFGFVFLPGLIIKGMGRLVRR